MAGEPFIRLLNRAKSSRRLSVPIPGIIDKQRHLSLMYQPPFSISSAAVNLIAEISALVERYAIPGRLFFVRSAQGARRDDERFGG